MAVQATVNSQPPWMARRSRKRYDLDLQMLPQPTISIPRKKSLASVHSASSIDINSPESAIQDDSSRTASIRDFNQGDSCSSTSSSPILEFQSKSKTQIEDSRPLSSLPQAALPRRISHSSHSEPEATALPSRRPSRVAVPPDVVQMLRTQIAANEAQIAANCARMAEIQLAGDEATAGIQTRLAAVSEINDQLNQLRSLLANM